ncbi:SdrH family protein [Staphylococcus sp. HMSC065A08]|uniref:SdrH family protein n=1 Tax=Staphylococcus sp. HMSC065A08 TaxID=1739417 RepID=UPI002108D40F|nr:SdrH family protein [Staphylococcus sp. HMSC065A08]
MNKVLISSFAFAISAALISKPIQAVEDQNNNTSTGTKNKFAETDEMGRSYFAPSISNLYNVDDKENSVSNVENNNIIKNELTDDNLKSDENYDSLNDNASNNDGSDTHIQPDNPSEGDISDTNEEGGTEETAKSDQPDKDEDTSSKPDEPSEGDTSDTNEDGDTGETSKPDQPDKDEDTSSKPDEPSEGDTSDTNGDGDTGETSKPDKPNKNEESPSKPDEPSEGDTSDTNEDGDTGETSKPDQPDKDEDTSSKPDEPSEGDTSDTNEDGDTGETSKPDQPDKDEDTSSKPDEPSEGDTSDTNEGGGSSPKPDKPSDGNTSGSNGGTGTPTKPDRPNLTPPSNSHYPNTPSNGNHESGNGDAYQPTKPIKPSYSARPNLKGSSENAQSNKYQSDFNYGDLAVKEDTNQASTHTKSDRQILNRFNQMSTGSFKYNPFVVNQVKQLNNGEEKISNREILSILRPQRFDDNAFLNELQKGTNYFKFQYFNPLKSQDYYKNLDNQVLALITGEIGSMPDLKNPKTESATGKYEYHSSGDEEMTETADKDSKNTIDIKFERILFALITAIFIIFVGVVVGYFVHRKNKNNE